MRCVVVIFGIVLAPLVSGCGRALVAVGCGMSRSDESAERCRDEARYARERRKQRDRDAAACDRGVPSACFEAARYDDGPRAGAGTARRFEVACAAAIPENGQACYRAADFFEDGRGVKADPRRASQLFERSCALGHGVACERLGTLTQSSAQRLVYDERACSLKVWTSCHRGGVALHRGDAGTVDLAKARALYAAGCAGSHRASCIALGELDVAEYGVVAP